MKKISYLLIITSLLIGCSSPKTFVKTNSVNWSTIEIREGLTYEKAFSEVVDIVAKDFEMEMISKDGGYARTGWIYTFNPKKEYNDRYRTRVLIKFSSDRTKVDVKTEAQFGKKGEWKNGYDTALLNQIKQDIMGVVGRTTH